MNLNKGIDTITKDKEKIGTMNSQKLIVLAISALLSFAPINQAFSQNITPLGKEIVTDPEKEINKLFLTLKKEIINNLINQVADSGDITEDEFNFIKEKIETVTLEIRQDDIVGEGEGSSTIYGLYDRNNNNIICAVGKGYKNRKVNPKGIYEILFHELSHATKVENTAFNNKLLESASFSILIKNFNLERKNKKNLEDQYIDIIHDKYLKEFTDISGKQSSFLKEVDTSLDQILFNEGNKIFYTIFILNKENFTKNGETIDTIIDKIRIKSGERKKHINDNGSDIIGNFLSKYFKGNAYMIGDRQTYLDKSHAEINDARSNELDTGFPQRKSTDETKAIGKALNLDEQIKEYKGNIRIFYKYLTGRSETYARIITLREDQGWKRGEITRDQLRKYIKNHEDKLFTTFLDVHFDEMFILLNGLY